MIKIGEWGQAMKNEWKNVWMKHSADIEILQGKDRKKIFLELKRSNGFDVIGDGLSYEALMCQYIQIKENLTLGTCGTEKKEVKSVYEVGCGSGANLYLFESDGMQTGGIDYSENLIQAAKKVLSSEDIICDEAINIPVTPAYDSVFSNSVFSYFENENYAWDVLEKMYQKSKYSIGLIDIHDIEKKEEFIIYRRKNVENYEERYKNLPKLFYSRRMFIDFAKKHGMDIKFTDSEVDGYWNNEFVFNCYMYKRRKQDK